MGEKRGGGEKRENGRMVFVSRGKGRSGEGNWGIKGRRNDGTGEENNKQ